MKTTATMKNTLKQSATAFMRFFMLVALCTCKGNGNTVLMPDTTAPVTTASPGGGAYGEVQYVTLSTNEEATVSYSIDGANPAEGAPNTISGPSPVFWLRIGAGTTILKFFAVDSKGNQELVKTETYVVTISSPPAPVANAGPDRTVLTGTLVTLDGSGSSTSNGVSPTFRWSFTSMPAGSAASLSSTTAVHPTFTPDLDGTYVISLVVNDAQTDSAADTVTITATNASPIANAGPDQTVLKGTLVTLDGSGSNDANGDPLAYMWSITSMPAGSAAALSSTTAIHPTFTPDLDGTYVISLVVNDGKMASVADTVVIKAARYLFTFDDGTLQGWTTNGSWGVTTAYAHSGGYSATDSPVGNYANNTNTSLISPVLDLTGTTSVALTFYHRYSIQSGWDFGMLEISTDGGVTFGPALRTFTGSLSTFTPLTVDLSSYAGYSTVVIRFRLTSDSTVTYDGWYIDDITIGP